MKTYVPNFLKFNRMNNKAIMINNYPCYYVTRHDLIPLVRYHLFISLDCPVGYINAWFPLSTIGKEYSSIIQERDCPSSILARIDYVIETICRNISNVYKKQKGTKWK